jgi:predicted O-methyltransferase YrrM
MKKAARPKKKPAIRRTLLAPDIERYVSRVITRETPAQQRLRRETAAMPMGLMQIGADQGAFFSLLVRLTGAKRALEIGTFTGYSALAVAAALPDDGRLTACDVNAEWTAVARRYWEQAGVSRKVDLRLGPALDTLAALKREGASGSYDFAFIDADKTGYDAYYEACLELLRPGGLIALDNMLWGGAVADPSVRDADTRALRALNLKVRDDARVESCLLTVGDGVMLVRKKG